MARTPITFDTIRKIGATSPGVKEGTAYRQRVACLAAPKTRKRAATDFLAVTAVLPKIRAGLRTDAERSANNQHRA